jgi:hypothetical protein
MSAFSFGFDANPVFAAALKKPEAPAASQALSRAHWFCNKGDTVFEVGEPARLWRVVSGVLCLVQRDHDAQHLMSLALPGDLLGIEALCRIPHPLPHRLRAEALTDVVLVPVDPASEGERQQLMVAALLQQQQRSHDTSQLRTGPVLLRVAALLKVLGHAAALVGEPQDPDALRGSLPVLRELALVVDAKHETVCRVLSQLLPPRTRKSGPRRCTAAGAAVSASARAAVQALGLSAKPDRQLEGAMA